MSDPTETARRVLDLDKQATQGPWAPWIVQDRDEDAALWIASSSCHNADEAQVKKDAALIAEYRTAAPELARALIESQAALAAANARADAAEAAEAAAIRTMDQALDEYAKLPRVEADLATAREAVREMVDGLREARAVLATSGGRVRLPEQKPLTIACIDSIDALLAKHAAPEPTLADAKENT